MRNFLFLICAALGICACNSVYVRPDTLAPNSVVYADRGGYSMRRSIKQELERRGYHVVVGVANSNTMGANGEYGNIEIDTYTVPNDARYIVKVSERSERFRPIWCVFNGFWWWNFNVSIADQENGTEIMSWRGRGCANSSVRKLNRILDEMEK